MTSYLASGVHCSVEPLEDSAAARQKAQKAEAALRLVEQDNGLEQLTFETEIDCAILGDACFKVTWDAERKAVRVTAPDIQGVYAWWLGDDTARIWRVASRYRLEAAEAAARYGVETKGKTAGVVELWTEDLFQLWLDDSCIEEKANPYGFIPFVIYPNLREPKKFWGTSDWSFPATPSPCWKMWRSRRTSPSNRGRCGTSPMKPGLIYWIYYRAAALACI